MNSTIGRKIGFAFLVILILVAVMVVITFSGFNTITNRLDEIEQESNKRGVAGNLRFSVTQLLMSSNDYVITEKDYYKREYNRLKLTVDDYLKQFIQFQLTENELLLAEKIKRDIDSIHTISAKIFSIPNPRQSPKASSLMKTMDYRFGEHVNVKITKIFDEISLRINDIRILISTDKENATNSIYIMIFSTVFISILVSYFAVQRISKPIINITKAAKCIASGDYSQRPKVKTHDEIAVLAESFSSMAYSIQKSQKALEERKRLKEAEEKMRMAKELAEKSDRLKSEFLAQMSHEIRSPLNAILNFTSLIKEETSEINSEELEISFSAIDSASKRIIRTVDLILNMTDLQHGTYIVSKRLVELTTLLKKLIKEYESTAKVKNLKLKYNCELGKTDIETDDYAISQILANLIDNAIKYTDEGFIEIRLLQENNKYIVEIEDSGIGISEEYLPELFSPFSQEEHGYSRKFEGTGLGMSLVKKYCELIDAEITVKSKKDVGTTFSVILKN